MWVDQDRKQWCTDWIRSLGMCGHCLMRYQTVQSILNLTFYAMPLRFLGSTDSQRHKHNSLNLSNERGGNWQHFLRNRVWLFFSSLPYNEYSWHIDVHWIQPEVSHLFCLSVFCTSWQSLLTYYCLLNLTIIFQYFLFVCFLPDDDHSWHIAVHWMWQAAPRQHHFFSEGPVQWWHHSRRNNDGYLEFWELSLQWMTMFTIAIISFWTCSPNLNE